VWFKVQNDVVRHLEITPSECGVAT